MDFNIDKVDERMREPIQQKIDNLNKPKGSLGRLETLAMQLCLIQQTLEPRLSHPCHLLLGGDHGIEREGVSVSPREVTWQQMLNFTRGGGGVNMFCRQHGFSLRIVDVGVDYDFTEQASKQAEGSVTPARAFNILDRKIARGTRNFLYEAAMTSEEYEQALQTGADLADDCHREGCNIISIGEMGIANTSPSSIWMHLFTDIPLADCIGAGAGLNSEGVSHKFTVLDAALKNFYKTHEEYKTLKAYSNPQLKEIIRYFGGYEMVAAIGAMLRGTERHMTVLIDGFIMTACALAAVRLYPESQDYMVFTHCGDESGHRLMLNALNAHPLLNLGLRLGEGTGALCAYPLVESAVRMMNEMNTFETGKITKYF